MPFFQTFSEEMVQPGTWRPLKSARRRSRSAAGVDQRAEGHVAADTGKTIKIGEFHEGSTFNPILSAAEKGVKLGSDGALMTVADHERRDVSRAHQLESEYELMPIWAEAALAYGDHEMAQSWQWVEAAFQAQIRYPEQFEL